MSDILYVNGLEAQATIGIAKWEQAITQKISVDIEMIADVQQAAKSDNIDATIDYQQVSARIISAIEQSNFQLLETLAEHCANIILAEFNVPGVKLTMSKPGIVANTKDSGVTIYRGTWPTE